MGIRPRRLQHVGLVAGDLEAMVEFYCEVLDLRVSDRMPYPDDFPITEGVFLRCNSDHHVVSLFGARNPLPPGDGDSRREDKLGLHHFAFELASFEELRAAVRYVRGRDLPVRSVRHGGPGSHLRIYFWDPEDNLIELFWALDSVGWDGVSRQWPQLEEVDVESFDVEAWLEWKGPDFTRGATEAVPG